MKRDRYMEADDLFIDGVKQVFSVRTGDFVGYRGMIEPVDQQPDPEPVEVENQLTLEL